MDWLKSFVSRWWKPAVTAGCTFVGMNQLPLPDWATFVVGSICTIYAAKK